MLPQHRGHIAPVICPVVDHMTQDVGEIRIETAVTRMLDCHSLVRVGRPPQQIAKLFSTAGEQPPHLINRYVLRFLPPTRDLRENALVRNFRKHVHIELFEHVHMPERLRHGRDHARHFRMKRILRKQLQMGEQLVIRPNMIFRTIDAGVDALDESTSPFIHRLAATASAFSLSYNRLTDNRCQRS